MNENDNEVQGKAETFAQRSIKMQAEAAANKAQMTEKIAEIKEKIDLLMQFKIESVTSKGSNQVEESYS